MVRLLIIPAIVGLTSLLPALCLGGVIEHPCGDCTEDAFCSHEEGCLADPCADAAVRQSAQDSGGAPLLQPCPAPAGLSRYFPPSSLGFPTGICPPPPRKKNLPIPESGLPLLI